jgi:flagellin
MADIALSQGVRQNLLAMQKTVDLMARTQNRLATGKKVNSALDNPTSYFVSAGLENRANDLSRILDSMGLGIKTIEAADNGIKAIKKLIETMQGTARQALQAATSTARIRSALPTTLTDATTTTSLGLRAGDQLTIDSDGRTLTIDLDPATTPTVGDIVDAINAAVGAGELNETRPRVTASISTDGKLEIENIQGNDIGLTFVAGAAAAPAVENDLSTLFGVAAAGLTQTLDGTLNTIRSGLAEQFEGLKAQIDQLIKDTGYNGVNLLNGDTLKVLFNENNTTFIDIAGVVFNAQGLGLAPLINGSSADTPNVWQSDSEIKAALSKLDAALNLVRSQASDFGSNLTVLQTRQDFTKQSIATLNAGSDLLVLADVSEEGANLLALQTRQQLSTQALSLSAQTDQAVLRLFG